MLSDCLLHKGSLRGTEPADKWGGLNSAAWTKPVPGSVSLERIKSCFLPILWRRGRARAPSLDAGLRSSWMCVQKFCGFSGLALTSASCHGSGLFLSCNWQNVPSFYYGGFKFRLVLMLQSTCFFKSHAMLPCVCGLGFEAPPFPASSNLPATERGMMVVQSVGADDA